MTEVFSVLIGFGPRRHRRHAVGRAESGQVAVDADLQRRLAVAEQVIHDLALRREVLVADVVLLREREIAVGVKRVGPSVCSGKLLAW